MRSLLTVLCACTVLSVLATDLRAKSNSRVGGVPQTEQAAALLVLKRAFRTDEAPPDVEARVEAIRGLAIHDTQKVAKALVKVYVRLEERLLARALERSEWIAERAMLKRGKEYEAKPSFPTPVFDRLATIRASLAAARTEIDGIRTVQSELRSRLSATRDEPAAAWLLKTVLGSKKYSTSLSLAVSRVAGQLDGELVDDLRRLFKRAKRPSQILALLEGVSFAGRLAQSLAPQVMRLLEHQEGPVRERAAITLSKLAVSEAIEPLIDLLERESGRTQKSVARALAVLTRHDHGVLVAAWRRWWADEKEKILGGETELGGGMFGRNSKLVDRGYYFDLEVEGKSVMYVIDSSGSMNEPIEHGADGEDGEDGEDGDAKVKTRLEACKVELVRALGRHTKDEEFNVIWYNDSVHLYDPAMQSATRTNVAATRAWVGKLVPNSSTNIYDGLKTAFDVAGQGAKDKYYGVGMDTIFLLTDGAPTTEDGKPDSTEKILAAVRGWNPLQRITIHVIGIGDGVNVGFLAALAEENNGEFRQF